MMVKIMIVMNSYDGKNNEVLHLLTEKNSDDPFFL